MTIKRSNKEKIKSKNKKGFKIFASILVILIIATSGTWFFVNSKLSKIKTNKIDESKLSINEDKFKSKDDFINILLIGVDIDKEANGTNSADSILIATLDKKNKEFKLTSVMRDSMVNAENHDNIKLKYAYSYGGPELLIKTINSNFNMNIKDYVKVNIFDLEKIINYLGGVSINIKSEEINQVNSTMSQVAHLTNNKYIPIKEAGLQQLDGRQAVAYSRIRYVGNVDFERTERQRRVLNEVFKKLTQQNVIELSKSMDNILPYVETSLSKGELISLGSYVLINKINKIEQFRIPTDDNYHDATINGLYYMKWDKEPTIDKLHNFIFEK